MRIVQALVTAIHSASPLSGSTLAIAGLQKGRSEAGADPYPSRIRCVVLRYRPVFNQLRSSDRARLRIGSGLNQSTLRLTW